MKVSELPCAVLNCFVAKAENPQEKVYFNSDGYTLRWHVKPKPYSTAWEHGGVIIERERIQVMPALDWNGNEAGWNAFVELHRSKVAHGPTPLIAAMRAYVASKFGEEVELNSAVPLE